MSEVKAPVLFKGAKQYRYYFYLMDIDDHFFASYPYSRENMWKLSNAARNWGNKQAPKKRFAVKKVDEKMICVRTK